ncbi:ankyrin repeat and MYND domain-containing protein 1 isoform X2 [Neoarius graeffei]|uniref:ankyrin repeat and MYND domain-containing protein 1 isoform X2 n=1 Tax=Neoarius graeffei TaxID=443677 RepID=UPI00298CB246|nr:ankyrin repeat and MYND domain-containing protein 1 isoform X2 [Neoarius graeffei]
MSSKRSPEVSSMMNTGLCVRNGPGLQEWTDGSRYDGDFINGLKHGNGTFTWPNGECYKGSFYKDYRHGRGTYFWPDGSQFVGKFYLNCKEGYGIHLFFDGTVFKGLYHANERFGPGVMSYPDGCQDVGLWHCKWLLRLCTTVKGGFTLMDFPEHMARLPQQHLTQIQSLPSFTMESCTENQHFFTVDTYLLGDSSCLEKGQFILPPGIENYSTDSDHLPIPQCLRQELDLHFFNRSDISMPLFFNALPLQQRMKAHIHTHRFEVEELDWDVAVVLAMNRDHFGPKGPLEVEAERLIREASLGNLQNVQSILRGGKVHPNVGDVSGHTALIAATVSCHDDVIDLLLDSGADVNKLNNEGMSALAVCSVLYYPFHSLQETVAEKTSHDVITEPEIIKSRTLDNSPQGSAAENRPKDEVDTELTVTDSQTDQVKPEECSTAQESETPEHTEEIKTPSKGEEVPQQAQNEQGRVVEAEQLEESEPLNERIPGDISAWYQADNEGENILSTEKEEKSYRNRSPGKDPGFDLASSSFHIDITEDTQQTTEVRRETGQVSTAETQETVHRLALMKIQNETRWATMKLLLERGADPNVSSIPMPVIFLAIKAGHVEAVQRLLERGARTDLHLTAEQKGLYPLHVAAGLTGPEGPKITGLLLRAVADPDVKAQDANEVYDLDKTLKKKQVGGRNMSLGSEPPSCIYTPSIEASKEGGRTPLHIACQRDTDYVNARDVVSILLSHKASTDHLWSGHSPLSLAIASGNDLAVDELLAAGADPNLPLSCQVGSALCAAANIYYNSGLHLRNRIKLVEKLIKAGANILMPVVIGEGSRSAIGTVVDYAHYMFNKDWRVAHIPYHALKQQEREAYNACHQLITMMAELMRQAATSMEKQCLENKKSQGIKHLKGVSFTDTFVLTSTGAMPPANRTRTHTAVEEQRASVNKSMAQKRKPLFKYCYQCGRTAWVALTPCSRCHEVFYCSKMCKLKAWNERHKEECIRVSGSGHPEGSHISGGQRCRRSSKRSRKGNNLNFKLDKPNSSKAAPQITHQYNPEENYSFN